MSESSEKAQLYLLISGKYYLVERIRFEGERAATRGWRLTHFDDKLNHSPYCVIRQPSGRLSCECAHFTFAAQEEALQKSRESKQRIEPTCKHIDALKQIGLLK